MITKDELKKKYDDKSIDSLELMAITLQTDMRKAQIEMVCILYYLKVSKRYKENKRYAKASFDEYLEGIYGIREGTFLSWQRAVINWPDEVRRHNIGLVSKVAKLCNPVQARKAFAEIDRVIKTSKKESPAVSAKIEKIIEAYRTPRKIKKRVTNYKAMYERELSAHEATKRELASVIKANRELLDQIERLKGTAERFTEVRRIVEQQAHA